MAYYYKIGESDDDEIYQGMQAHKGNAAFASSAPSIKYDFSNHVLIELIDDVTPEPKVWKELGLSHNDNVIHKRMMVDTHRVHCRRAIVICTNSDEAKLLAQRVSQTKIQRRCVCAVVVQELLTDLSLFEKQILNYGDKRSQQALLYVSDLNRSREPASLAQYLRDKFAAFGNIDSVFVAEDKDGYAYPEGVIKFTYLSEAFAAELAYDQFVVGMERLSVTTHHNIVLSQCDLRVRLREAQLKNESCTSNSTFRSTLSPLKELNGFEDDNCSMQSCSQPSKTKISTPIQIKHENGYPKDALRADHLGLSTSELSDVLNNSCRENLMECLRGLRVHSDSSVTKESFDDTMSSASNINSENTTLKLNENNAVNAPLDSLPLNNDSWATRISKWIDGVSGGCVDPIGNSVPFSPNKNQFLENTVKPQDVVSTVCSFVTCEGEDQRAVLSVLSDNGQSPAGDNSNGNETIVNDTSSCDSFHSLEGKFHSQSSQSNGHEISSNVSSAAKHCNSISLSQKRKIASAVSSKLSLKSQRLDSFSQKSNCNLTLPINDPKTDDCSGIVPSTFDVVKSNCNLILPINDSKRDDCSEIAPSTFEVVKSNCNSTLPINDFKTDDCSGISPSTFEVIELNCNLTLPINNYKTDDLSGISTTSEVVKSPVVCLKRLSSEEILNLSNPKKSQNYFVKKDVHKTGSGASHQTDAVSVKSLSSRRSSRLASRHSNSNCGSSKRQLSMELVAISDRLQNPTETPLRIWLKKELTKSSNNRLTSNSNKKIVCAANRKDVLISIGCSHMTCDSCYPGSNNLLFGCR